MSVKSPIVEIAKSVCPAVITVVVSRDLPKIESFYSFPFGGKEYLMPKMEKGKNVKEKVEKTQIYCFHRWICFNFKSCGGR
jgi:hypothetical protein